MWIPIVIVLVALLAWKIGTLRREPPKIGAITEYRFVDKDYRNDAEKWTVIHEGAEPTPHLIGVVMAKVWSPAGTDGRDVRCGRRVHGGYDGRCRAARRA
jgi:hypothetical protein